ncbi:MAG: hypothetical protein ACD_71C00056G0003 [uncultured bacterium (gcode 4)]|uniref:Uncharacterized protein n=1 Tax=uncultured bacterium (gcode 4) TaxID=1234023 RepID=K1ZJU2_9BACT|nr:MAG: hypothetical protein ACD_71C00056G0003 [uncultured bacterium (gcode 4)]
MDKKTKIISIVETIADIFEIGDIVKVDLYDKLMTFDNERLFSVAKLLVDYKENQTNLLNNLSNNLKITQNKIIELNEKKQLLNDKDDILNNL